MDKRKLLVTAYSGQLTDDVILSVGSACICIPGDKILVLIDRLQQAHGFINHKEHTAEFEMYL